MSILKAPSIVIFFLTSSFTTPQETQNSSSLVAQGIELLQKNEKAKALKILEKAFDNSHDPEELKEIAVLLVEATPPNHPKRESYLRYLVRFSSEHPEVWKWYRDLGNLAFEKGRFQEAEDWFLRALPQTDDKAPLQFKLAYVVWNMKRPLEALSLLLDIYQISESGFRDQIKRDIPKLWMEIGTLPPEAFDQIKQFDSTTLEEISLALFGRMDPQVASGSIEEKILKQFETAETLRPALVAALQTDRFKKKRPCLAFKIVLRPSDSFDPIQLLLCQKKKELEPDQLLPFFAALNSTDETLTWAHLELLVQMDRIEDAVRRFMAHSDFAGASKNFLSYGESLWLRLDEEKTKLMFSEILPERFEAYLQAYRSSSLLERLQVTDPDRWIPYEGALFAGKETKSYLLKKGAWLARKPNPPVEELGELFQRLISKPIPAEAKGLAKTYKQLVKRMDSSLPPTFSLAFKSRFDEWLSDLDRSLQSLDQVPAEWQLICEPVFKKEVEKNVEIILSQLSAVTLDPEMAELSETFDQKKNEIRDQLQRKYLGAP